MMPNCNMLIKLSIFNILSGVFLQKMTTSGSITKSFVEINPVLIVKHSET